MKELTNQNLNYIAETMAQPVDYTKTSLNILVEIDKNYNRIFISISDEIKVGVFDS